MNLRDIRNGDIKIKSNTVVTYNGQAYRGLKSITELVDRVLPKIKKEVKYEPTKPTEQRKRKATVAKKRVIATIESEPDTES